MWNVASLLKQKNDFTWPGESNATCMARGLYFALQTMSKFLLLFLCACYYNAKAGIFGWIPEMQDFLKQFCSSNYLFFFFFLFLPSPYSPSLLRSCTCAFSDPAQGLFWEYICYRLCSTQLILCYPVPRVCLFRRCFIELLPLDLFHAFLGKSSWYLVHWGHLIDIHEEDEDPGSNVNINLH